MLFEADYAKNYASILYQCLSDGVIQPRMARSAAQIECSRSATMSDTLRARGYDRGLSVIRTFASKNAA